jgi:hypothetical protein
LLPAESSAYDLRRVIEIRAGAHAFLKFPPTNRSSNDTWIWFAKQR